MQTFSGMEPGDARPIIAPNADGTNGHFLTLLDAATGQTGWQAIAAPDFAPYARLDGADFTGAITAPSLSSPGYLTLNAASGSNLEIQNGGTTMARATAQGFSTVGDFRAEGSNNYFTNAITLLTSGVPATGAKYEFRNGSPWFSITDGSTGRGSVLMDTFWATGACAALDGQWRVTVGSGCVQYQINGPAAHQFIGAPVFVEGNVEATQYRQRSSTSPLVFRSMLDHTGGAQHTQWLDYQGNVAMWLYGNQYGAAEIGITTIRTTGIYGGVAWQPIVLQAGGAFGTTGDIISWRSGDGNQRATLSYLGGLTLNDFANIGGNLTPGPSTFATLPDPSTSAGAMRRVTDRAQRVAYSDGTDWRWIADDSIAS